jgi:hypothetical protein
MSSPPRRRLRGSGCCIALLDTLTSTYECQSAAWIRPLRSLDASFRRSLRARNKSDRTVEAYTDAVRLFAGFLATVDYP